MTLGAKLQLLRKQKNMSQEQLAFQLKVSRQAISKWELDSSLPDVENVIQLSRLFGVSTDYLLREEMESGDPIPALKENAVPIKKEAYNTAVRAVGIICAGLGLLGNIALLILSTMIKVPVTKTYTAADGTAHYYGGGDVLGYNLGSFIEKYKLTALLITFVVLLIIGFALIISSNKKRRTFPE